MLFRSGFDWPRLFWEQVDQLCRQAIYSQNDRNKTFSTTTDPPAKLRSVIEEKKDELKGWKYDSLNALANDWRKLERFSVEEMKKHKQPKYGELLKTLTAEAKKNEKSAAPLDPNKLTVHFQFDASGTWLPVFRIDCRNP